jgi:hypothetical protein
MRADRGGAQAGCWLAAVPVTVGWESIKKGILQIKNPPKPCGLVGFFLVDLNRIHSPHPVAHPFAKAPGRNRTLWVLCVQK